MSRSARSRACDIPKKTAQEVKLRDQMCVICGSQHWIELHHHITRSRGGLGVKENLVCLCKQCHTNLHSSTRSKSYRERVEEYLKSIYPNWNKNDVTYKKYKWID